MIKVGVFWVFALLDVDIIFDTEEYSDDCLSNETLLTYSKQHKDVWEKLTEEQCKGKYSIYSFDALPRGRVSYDAKEKYHKIVFYCRSKEFINTALPKLKKLFAIEKCKIDYI